MIKECVWYEMPVPQEVKNDLERYLRVVTGNTAEPDGYGTAAVASWNPAASHWMLLPKISNVEVRGAERAAAPLAERPSRPRC